ncbi:hypothetical protein NPIL_58301 [Nephila pilipes]|uniref:Uncharacterized protein n=1 Tax=Nephila pilipes TaxID=299642 RepID=A0A8X6NM46_NEPPI|nr:hypothetical protein NPIL_58301 [Nephila pilipes]
MQNRIKNPPLLFPLELSDKLQNIHRLLIIQYLSFSRLVNQVAGSRADEEPEDTFSAVLKRLNELALNFAVWSLLDRVKYLSEKHFEVRKDRKINMDANGLEKTPPVKERAARQGGDEEMSRGKKHLTGRKTAH